MPPKKQPTKAASNAAVPSPAALEELVLAAVSWVQQERIAELVPREDLERFRTAELEKLRPAFDRGWEWLDRVLERVQRPLRDVLGSRITERLLRLAEELEPDAEAVRVALRTAAVQNMLGEILYDGIREFLRRADLVGNIIDKLPLLGGLRRRVMATLETELEARLEVQVKGFLGSFTTAAAEIAIAHVLSPAHRKDFRQARRAVALHLLGRSAASFLPSQEGLDAYRDTLWKLLEDVVSDEKQKQQWLDDFYADVAADTVGDRAPFEPPQLLVVRLAVHMRRFFESPAAQEWLRQHWPAQALV